MTIRFHYFMSDNLTKEQKIKNMTAISLKLMKIIGILSWILTEKKMIKLQNTIKKKTGISYEFRDMK